jgi:TolA-binding protein
MKNLIHTTLVLSLAMLAACAHSGGKSSKTKAPGLRSEDQNQLRLLKAHEEMAQDQLDRKRVLRKKNEAQVAYRANPQTKKMDFSPQIFSKAEKLQEKNLYTKLLNSYNQNDSFRFQSYYRSFMKRFGKSPLADDAVYLSGLLSLSAKEYGPALLSFNQILNKYPYSNKTTAAMYAKGVSLKRMNLSAEANQVFSQVIKKYPGSPESLRAKVELRIVK